MSPNPNQMVVEDEDLRGIVIGVMRHYLGGWSTKEAEWPVNIRVGNSASEVLQEDDLITSIQESGVTALGVVIDAEDNMTGRWQRIGDFCKKRGVQVPNACPPEGFIADGVLGKRFGAWIMPNNQDCGMLENFCHDLVPSADPLWGYAQECCVEAKRRGAPHIDNHGHKAQIHTWLAWQNPPGERMGSAVRKNILKPTQGYAPPFAAWFRNLYKV